MVFGLRLIAGIFEMTTLIGTIFTTLCGSIMTLLLYSMVVLIQHLPEIMMVVIELFKSVTRISVLVLRAIFESIAPRFAYNTNFRLIAPVVISILICMGITHQVTGKLIFWPFIIAIFYGLSVGITWIGGYKNNRLRLGVDL